MSDSNSPGSPASSSAAPRGAFSEADKHEFDCSIKLYEIYRGYAVHEDNLVNNRMTWLLSIHGFLYATYGFTLQKKLEVIQKADQSEAKISVGLQQLFDQADLFLILIACVGSIISFYAFRSIRAARKSVQTVRALAHESLDVQVRDKVTSIVILKRFLPDIAGGGRVDVMAGGTTASSAVPVFLLIGWVFSAIFIAILSASISVAGHIWIVPTNMAVVLGLLWIFERKTKLLV